MRSSTVCLALLLIFAITSSSGCSRGSRCYVRPDRHEQARRLYERTGSIELTERTLREAQWLDCEVNQTVARLVSENTP